MTLPARGKKHDGDTGFFTHLEPREMASFVRRDYEILDSRYRMRRWFYRGSLRAILDRAAIYRGVRQSAFNFSWFAYHQAYLAVRDSIKLDRKSIVVLGGFDVCEEEDPTLPSRLPEIRYILSKANLLLAVSERVRSKALAIQPTAAVRVVYHGFESNHYSPAGVKERVVTTIGYVKRMNLKRKGLEVFVRAAAHLPELTFYVVGGWLDESIDFLRSIATSNVVFTGHIADDDLVGLLHRTRVYVQASLHEGFGCSLAEAMLCECVPVVSDKGAIPEVVGDTGVYVDPTDSENVAAGIARAMDLAELGTEARKRITTRFPIEVRRERLIREVEGILTR